MTDVVKIAKKRLNALEAQIVDLEDFILMAEALLKDSLSNSNMASATDGNDAEAEREDLSVLELKAGERVRDSRAIHNEPSPDRHYPSMGRLHR